MLAAASEATAEISSTWNFLVLDFSDAMSRFLRYCATRVALVSLALFPCSEHFVEGQKAIYSLRVSGSSARFRERRYTLWAHLLTYGRLAR